MNILFAALGIFILYLIQRKLYQRTWNKNLYVNMAYSKETAVEGEEAALVEVITNDKRLPLPALTVKFQTSRKLNFLNSENLSLIHILKAAVTVHFRIFNIILDHKYHNIILFHKHLCDRINIRAISTDYPYSCNIMHIFPKRIHRHRISSAVHFF